MEGSGVPHPVTNPWGYWFDYEANKDTINMTPDFDEITDARQAYEDYETLNKPSGEFVLPERNEEVLTIVDILQDLDDNGNPYTYTVESVTSYPGPTEYGGNGQPSVELETQEAFISDYKMYFATQKVDSGDLDTAGNPIKNTVIKRDAAGNPVIKDITLGTYTRWKTGFSEESHTMLTLPQGVWPIWAVTSGGTDQRRGGYPYHGGDSSHYRSPLFPTRDHLGNRYDAWSWVTLDGAYNPHFDTTQILSSESIPGSGICHKVYSFGANLSRQGILWPAFHSEGEVAMWDISMHDVTQIAIRAYTASGKGQHWGPKLEAYNPNNVPSTFGSPNRPVTAPYSFTYFNDSDYPASVLNGYASQAEATAELNREVYSAYFGDAPIPTDESTRDGRRNNEDRRVVNIEGVRSGFGFSMNPIGDWDRPNGTDGNVGQFYFQSLGDDGQPEAAPYAVYYPGADGDTQVLQDSSFGPNITGIRYRTPETGEPQDGVRRFQITTSSDNEIWPPYIAVWMSRDGSSGTWYVAERWTETDPTVAKYTLISSNDPAVTSIPSGGSTNFFDHIVVNYLDARPPSVNAYIGHWRDWDAF
jgi:hypothetical protein